MVGFWSNSKSSSRPKENEALAGARQGCLVKCALAARLSTNPGLRLVHRVLGDLTLEPLQRIGACEVPLRTLLDDVEPPLRVGLHDVVELRESQTLWHR